MSITLGMKLSIILMVNIISMAIRANFPLKKFHGGAKGLLSISHGEKIDMQTKL